MKCDKCGYDDNGTGDWAHVCGPVNIKAGADIHAGGGYSIGTQEEYEKFVKARNQSLLESKRKELSDRITDYLSTGGLFNPELANHNVVRDLLIECRNILDERTN